MSYDKFERAAIALMDLHVGDSVKINRGTKSYERGWKNTYDSFVEQYIGQSFKIVKLGDGGCGVKINLPGINYWLPIFCITKV